jgi:hypothetical protein
MNGQAFNRAHGPGDSQQALVPARFDQCRNPALEEGRPMRRLHRPAAWMGEAAEGGTCGQLS